jgi:hypothetical protein
MQTQNSRDPERIKRLFESIKEIKRENYIGTSAAWASIREREEFEQNPVVISGAINDHLKKIVDSDSRFKITYHATPERIIGIIDMTYVLNNLAVDRLKRHNNKKRFYLIRLMRSKIPKDQNPETLLCFSISFNATASLSGDVTAEEMQLKEESARTTHPIFTPMLLKQAERNATMVKHLGDIFKNAQEKNIRSNSKFMLFASLMIFNKLPLDENEAQICSKLIRSIMPDEISDESLKQSRYMHERFLIEKGFDIDSKINQIFRDGVDHRLEIRREVVSDFVSQLQANTGIKKYEQILRRAKNYYINSTINFFEDSETSAIAHRNISFILHLVRTEKHFINRYIRS